MADKISTIVIKIDLECERCYKKIRRVLCKIQDKMNIKTISFDDKSNAVTISGPFDAEKVCNKLCCEAGRVIKEMDIKGKEKAKDAGGDKPKDAAKGAEKDAGKPKKEEAKAEKKEEAKAEKKEEAKAEKKEAKTEKKEEAKAEKKETKAEKKEEAKAEKKEAKAEKKEDKKEGKADLGPLLEKMKAAKAEVMVTGAAQGVAMPSIWPAPPGSVSSYGYNPSYEEPSYYGGCGCGGYDGYCRCGKPAAPGGCYGVPVYDSQECYYGGGGARQPYYEDPNAGCSVM